MRLYLGTHMVSQEWDAGVPLFVSRRRLTKRRTLPQASSPLAAFFGGQIVAKGEMILVGVVLTAARRQALPSGAVLAP